MTTIFAVEKGDYSDYRVIGVFSTREKAQQLVDRVNGHGSRMYVAEIAEWQLDPPNDKLNSGLSMWNVDMHRDGVIENVFNLCALSDDDYSETCLLKDDYAPVRFLTGAFMRMEKTGKRRLEARVWARDKEHAVKIVNERRGQMIAMGEWEDAA